MCEYSLYTAGHGELSWDVFAAMLRPHSIEMLVDIRAYPYSETAPWFNRDQIERGARKEGWEYLWLGRSLGALTTDGRVDNLAKEREPLYHEGIKELLSISSEMSTCLVGAQVDPYQSHRHHLVSQTLLRQRVGVQHILLSGNLDRAQSDLFHQLH